ncbi:polyprenyl synthetase family protein [Glycomyces sp. TRM65418]|uniref:polyprenyl synthetase family protein n=1 Tax=Glycomyces sp. TRM65418 TaxID=2867006 RepID=UPI001D16546C|nr:polyprenyl synthetase family protein [Glycomyces sp. TRM65418]MCC3762375.1 polyprenyl synthetase family protein [Glycomyces sp. TRM65418]
MTVLTDRHRASKYRAEREAIDDGLRAAAGRLPGPAARIAAYHFGWTDTAGEPVEANSGKALRPLLTLLAAKAIDDEAWRQAVPAAVAVEMIHNFSLIHDDIIDRDSLRRHRPTAWKVYGVNDAILVGDALHALAFEIIAEAGGDRAAVGAGVLAQTVRSLIEGQLADTRFETRDRVELDECVAMSEAKTASLMGCATALGALFGGGTREQVDALRDFGFRLGLAFQHVDDLLGIWGDPAVTGKAVYSDLRNRKKSLPVTAALGSGHADAPELAELYNATGQLTEAELRRAADLVEACGGRHASRRSAETLTEAATGSLAAAGLRPEVVAELTGLAASTVDRANLWRRSNGETVDRRTANRPESTRLRPAGPPGVSGRARPGACCCPRRGRSAPGWNGRSRSSSGSWSSTGRRCTCATK